MKYRKYRKYKPKAKPKIKRKHKLKIKGRVIFGTALKNFGTYWYRGLGERWEEKNYAMRKLDTPKRVTLPNGKTFLAR